MGTITTRRARIAAVLLGLALVAGMSACEYPNPTPVPAGCSVTPTAGLETRTLGDRNYRLLVPPDLPDSGVGVPLLLSLHGLNSNADQMAGYTPWVAMAPTSKFIVAYPNAVNERWNHAQGSADVTFLRAVIADIESTYCTDPSRVHVVGHSEGAYMTQRMACDAPDLVGSVAEYAGGSPELFYGNTPCTPSRGIAVAMFHGTADRLVPMASYGIPSRDDWIARMHCNPTPVVSSQAVPTGSVSAWAPCDGNVAVRWEEFTGQGHLWPSSGPISDEMRDQMWAFLMAFPHPTR